MSCYTNEDFYIDKATGLLVFTAKYHLRRGYCCKSGCRHCPFGFNIPKPEKENQDTADNSSSEK